MFTTYSSNDVAANEEVDHTQQEFSSEVERDVQSIIRLAHQEHEALIQQKVMSAMKQREEEWAKLRDMRPSSTSLAQIKAVQDEELRALLEQIVSKEDSSDEDEYEYEDEYEEDPF
ncbi:uncharacterized protein LOC6527515 [Drosophila yakuba]|uniref:Uncharacterized protein n=1 Tax=Drosophila yakuba TaxID=7245 RepID=B4P375_DROYA|nr:uncharacterized protein LOC6527515 [Drosophila yakuba]EDW88317.2 uncharacterized protein Dyak_GE18658 [Drosophila yakuba]